jgi:hypothetical protein
MWRNIHKIQMNKSNSYSWCGSVLKTQMKKMKLVKTTNVIKIDYKTKLLKKHNKLNISWKNDRKFQTKINIFLKMVSTKC